jgi:hypothetical protein
MYTVKGHLINWQAPRADQAITSRERRPRAGRPRPAAQRPMLTLEDLTKLREAQRSNRANE